MRDKMINSQDKTSDFTEIDDNLKPNMDEIQPQQLKIKTLAFLQSVLYIPKPRTIVANIAKGKTINRFDFKLMLVISDFSY